MRDLRKIHSKVTEIKEVLRMTNEEFQRIVLRELKGLKKDVGGLEKGQQNLEEGQRNLEKRQGNLEDGQKRLEKGQREIKRELSFIWDDIKKIDNRLEEQEIEIKKVSS